MPLSREFKKLVAARANADPDFPRGLIIDAINMILSGEITAGRIMLRHYIDAKGGMDDICKQFKKHKSSIKLQKKTSSRFY